MCPFAVASVTGALHAASSGTAQQPSNEQRLQQATERMEEMKQRLNLTPEQSEKIRPIFQAEFAKLKEIRDKHQGDTSRRGRISMLREMHGVQEDAQKQIKPALTKGTAERMGEDAQRNA